MGENYNRERLVKELDAPGNVELRKKFLEYNRDSLNEACRRMSAGARRYNQHMRVGLMTTSLSWEAMHSAIKKVCWPRWTPK